MSVSFGKSLFISGIAALPIPVISPFVVSSIVPGSAFGAVLSSNSAVAYYLVTWAVATLAALVAVSLSLGKPAKARGSAASREEGGNQSGPEGKETGTVKWFNVNKGFGFITTSKGEDIFVHFRSIRGRGRRSLRQGQSVRFDISEGDKGLQADNVSVTSA